jgi:hypothetical protein
MRLRAALVRTDVSEELIASIIMLELITELLMLEQLSNSHPEDRGDIFLRYFGSEKIHIASQPRIRRSS